MIKVNVKSDSRALLRALQGNQKQIAIATSIALTKTAKQIEREEYAEIKRVFDRPTKYTLSGLFVKPSTKTNLEARIGIKNQANRGTPAEKYLQPNIVGGARNTKRFERAFISKGIMPQGYKAVPGAGAKLDAFGNVPAKYILQLINYLSTNKQTPNVATKRFIKGQAKQLAGAGLTYFVNNKQGNLPLGIYQRTSFASGSSIKPIFIFVKQVNYKQRYNFQGKADAIAKQFFPLYLKESVQQSLQYL
jgi:hypothetical protein